MSLSRDDGDCGEIGPKSNRDGETERRRARERESARRSVWDGPFHGLLAPLIDFGLIELFRTVNWMPSTAHYAYARHGCCPCSYHFRSQRVWMHVKQLGRFMILLIKLHASSWSTNGAEIFGCEFRTMQVCGRNAWVFHNRPLEFSIINRFRAIKEALVFSSCVRVPLDWAMAERTNGDTYPIWLNLEVMFCSFHSFMWRVSSTTGTITSFLCFAPTTATRASLAGQHIFNNLIWSQIEQKQ